jgi:hypothetical protein
LRLTPNPTYFDPHAIDRLLFATQQKPLFLPNPFIQRHSCFEHIETVEPELQTPARWKYVQ